MIKLALLQADIVWQNPKKNLKKFTDLIQRIKTSFDIVVLPEMFSTGFSMNPEGIAESMNGLTIKWMEKTASEKNCAICGSLIIVENTKFYNRFVFVEPSGKVHSYDKRHLFTLAGEEKIYTRGNSKTIINYKGWKICPQICYDLRFPVWARNTENYDVLLYVANWPKPRIMAWDTLLKARAIENMCYVVGVNRIGTDGNNLNYNGFTAAYDSIGNQIVTSKVNEVETIIVSLSKEDLEKNRNRFNFLNDRDVFKIN